MLNLIAACHASVTFVKDIGSNIRSCWKSSNIQRGFFFCLSEWGRLRPWVKRSELKLEVGEIKKQKSDRSKSFSSNKKQFYLFRFLQSAQERLMWLKYMKYFFQGIHRRLFYLASSFNLKKAVCFTVCTQ